jgi:hypothetical protein
MTVSGKDVIAYVDGELDDAARARIADAAQRDPALAARISAEQALRNQVRGHFAPVAQEPVPQDWIASIRTATAAPATTLNAVSMDAARAARAQRLQVPARGRGSGKLWVGAAIAASLVVGVMISDRMHQPVMLVAGKPVMLVASKDGLVASGELAQALNTQLASSQGSVPIRILGTFKRQGGDTCRVFAGAAVSGIACHDGGGWQMQQVVPGAKAASAAASGAYRQAGSDQAGLMVQAQAMMVGDPFDAAQERAARDHLWR